MAPFRPPPWPPSLFLVALFLALPSAHALVVPSCAILAGSRPAPTTGHGCGKSHVPSLRLRGGERASLLRSLKMALPLGAASLLAGSLGGAIGVGVAFPLDTLKTKAQTAEGEFRGLGAWATAKRVLSTEGVAGFYGGVQSMMVGQAIIKATAFAANAQFLRWEQGVVPESLQLVVAAMLSGLLTSLLVCPVERIKVMRQAAGKGKYANDLACAKAVLDADGVSGLFSRGLGATIAREVPSYGIYFVVYANLMALPSFQALGAGASLLAGALSGVLCWIPVYPGDVVKTAIQNTQGVKGESVSFWEVAREVYEEGGVGAFFDGIGPKVARAATNHAVTFFVYDLVMKNLAAE